MHIIDPILGDIYCGVNKSNKSNIYLAKQELKYKRLIYIKHNYITYKYNTFEGSNDCQSGLMPSNLS